MRKGVRPRANIPGTLLVTMLAAGAVMAQPAGSPPRSVDGRLVEPRPLQRVDPAFDDVGELRLSLRQLDVDLRVEDDFSLVYRLPGQPRGGQELFARRAGALTAVFPRSVYAGTQQGVYPEIPPGTVFYIGGLPVAAMPALPARPMVDTAAGLRVDRSVYREAPLEARSGRVNGAVQNGVADARPRTAPVEPAAEATPFKGVRQLLMDAAGAPDAQVSR